MKAPEQWTKERDFRGGEYDAASPQRFLVLIAEVQADALEGMVTREDYNITHNRMLELASQVVELKSSITKTLSVLKEVSQMMDEDILNPPRFITEEIARLETLIGGVK